MRKLLVTILILLFSLGVGSSAFAAASGYGATALTGGTTGCLDAIDGDALSDGDKANVRTSTITYQYHLNATSGAAESSPSVISPDDNAGTKRWILIGLYMSTLETTGAATIGGLATLSDLIFGSGANADVILDEDNMASDDADALATQQSIKAYVDAAGDDWTYTAQTATTSGTSVELTTAIPTGAKEIEILLSGVSLNTASKGILVQLGDAGGYEVTGYLGAGGNDTAAVGNEKVATTGYRIGGRGVDIVAADLFHGVLTMHRWDASEHQWIAEGKFYATSKTYLHWTAGTKTTSQALTSIKIVSSDGTATFDAGEARIRYR